MEVSEDDPRNTDYYAEISNVLWTWNGKFMTSWLRNYDAEDTSLTAHPRPYVWAFVIFSSVTRLSFKPKPWSFDHADSMKLHVCFVGGTSLLWAVLRVSPAPEAAVLDQISSRWKARALIKCCSSLLFEESRHCSAGGISRLWSEHSAIRTWAMTKIGNISPYAVHTMCIWSWWMLRASRHPFRWLPRLWLSGFHDTPWCAGVVDEAKFLESQVAWDSEWNRKRQISRGDWAVSRGSDNSYESDQQSGRSCFKMFQSEINIESARMYACQF